MNAAESFADKQHTGGRMIEAAFRYYGKFACIFSVFGKEQANEQSKLKLRKF